MIQFESFITSVLSQNEQELRSYFHEDARIHWPCTKESFTVEEYIEVNCRYPGQWQGEILSVHILEELAILAAKVYPKEGDFSHHVVSYIRCKDEKIISLREYWAEDGEVPLWRTEMLKAEHNKEEK